MGSGARPFGAHVLARQARPPGDGQRVHVARALGPHHGLPVLRAGLRPGHAASASTAATTCSSRPSACSRRRPASRWTSRSSPPTIEFVQLDARRGPRRRAASRVTPHAAAALGRLLRLPLRERRQDASSTPPTPSTSSRTAPQTERFVGVLPRRGPGDLRRHVLARRRDLGEGRLGPLEQHRRRRALPDGAAPSTWCCSTTSRPTTTRPSKACCRETRRFEELTRGTQAAEGLGRLRRAGDRALSASGRVPRRRARAARRRCSLLLRFAPPPVAALAQRRSSTATSALLPRERVARPRRHRRDRRGRARRATASGPGRAPASRELIVAHRRRRAAAIGVDLFFPEPDRFSPAGRRRAAGGPAADVAREAARPAVERRALAAALARGPVVLGVAGLETRRPALRAARRGAPPVRYRRRRRAGAARVSAGTCGACREIDAAPRATACCSVDPEGSVIRARALVGARVGDVTVPALRVEMLRVATGRRRC